MGLQQRKFSHARTTKTLTQHQKKSFKAKKRKFSAYEIVGWGGNIKLDLSEMELGVGGGLVLALLGVYNLPNIN